MRLTVTTVSLLAALGAASSATRADEEPRIGTFRGNVEKACARFAGHPPGRAECRSTLATGAALAPGQAYSLAISGFHGVLYYTAEGEQLQVVATLQGTSWQAPLRMVSGLAPEQSVHISVPDRPGSPAADVEVQRLGDFVVVRETRQVVSTPPAERSLASRQNEQ
jgi:hypothetical protein